jgi:hypothetical protein
MKKYLFVSTSALRGALFGFALASVLAFKWVYEKPGCAISLDKQNILVLGVDNPLTIVVRGIPEEKVKITAEGMTLEKTQGDDHYIARPKEIGEASITVAGEGLEQKFWYRVRRLPDPLLCLGGNPKNARDGYMKGGEFRAQGGLSAIMTTSDYGCGNCGMVVFRVTYSGKGQDAVSVMNTGGRFTPAAQALIDQAKPGDVYYFDQVRARCPGDKAPRDLGTLRFTIQ